MAGVPPNSLRQDELPEYSYVGPFGGLNSEVPLDKIARSGFAEVQNVLFRKSQALRLPAFVPLASPSSEVIIGIADFFNVNGERFFVVWTPTKMYYWTGTAWTQVTGTLTTSDPTTQFMSWDVIGYKLYFSQQADKVQVWDGITTSFAAASSSAVPGKYLCELDFHLLVANTIESGPTNAPNRVHWTGIGDGTDWTSFSSGQNDLFNGLGPINGLARIYQNAYAFQQNGICQIVPTGQGIAPFQFISMSSRAKGSILPQSVATFGEIISCYVGKNDVYVFDGTESIDIGSRGIDGNRRLGARGRIFTDINNASQKNIFGFITSSMNGVDYESYWLTIPSLNKAWVYHFDEQSWTQVYFNTGQLNGPVSVFSLQSTPRIEDLVGTIQAQTWTPDSLINPNPLDTMAIADANAESVSLMNFNQPGASPTSGSINTSDGWYIKSGQIEFDDARHNHSLKAVRVSMIDYANVTVYFRFTNEFGQQASWPALGYGNIYQLTYGTGSGQTLKLVIPVALQGKYITWEMSGPKSVNWGMSEIALVYDVSGEVQNAR